jgi:hypothetical protein
MRRRNQNPRHVTFDVIFNDRRPEAVRQWRWMAFALDTECAGGFLIREGNIDDHGAAIPQSLDDFVIAETRPIEIAARRDIRERVATPYFSFARLTEASMILT